MSLTLRATLLVCLLSVCAHAQTRTLVVYAEPIRGSDAEMSFFMRAELQRLLSPAGLEVLWKNSTGRKAGEDFPLVAVASFKGSCSSADTTSVPDTTRLGETAMSDGRVLPFFYVNCTALLQMLGPQPESPILGRALARVIAHEIYHVVTETTEHEDIGAAKSAFSVQDLISPRLEFDKVTCARLKSARISPSPKIPARATAETVKSSRSARPL
jgi:hypothetical protein